MALGILFPGANGGGGGGIPGGGLTGSGGWTLPGDAVQRQHHCRFLPRAVTSPAQPCR